MRDQLAEIKDTLARHDARTCWCDEETWCMDTEIVRWLVTELEQALERIKNLTPDYGPPPGPMDPHDRIDELERDDDAA